ncbi:Elicitor peptide [Arabidopsis suecica]|uniref:Elicitor peptide n=1 Tax=Arabidopsis suecica TaxID=45249 RepID=A0A8T1XWC3_ARASU|nr:Elicitor peptide [Arabidopsis suecica]
MEKSDRRKEEETYLWIPLQFLDQTLIAVLKCLGLLCPTAKKTASPPVILNQPEEQEEDDGVAMKDDDVVLICCRLEARTRRPKQRTGIKKSLVQVVLAKLIKYPTQQYKFMRRIKRSLESKNPRDQ